MAKYIFNRLLISIPILLGVVLFVFLMLNVIPGNPAEVMAGEKADQQTIDAMTEEMGLNDPVLVRFGKYVLNVLQGNFGISYKLRMNVSNMLKDAFPNTLKLTVYSLAFAWIIGIPAGIISAVKRNKAIDHIFMGFSLFGISMPVFWAAILFQWIFGVKLRLLPVSGFGTWKHFILPSIVVGWASTGSITRLVRSNLLEVMNQDYIRTARAKGLREFSVVIFHGLKNSLLPVVTIMAMQIAQTLSGAVVTESVFGIAGIGRLTVDAIGMRDMPMLQGGVIFSATIVILANLIADILYSALDPKIRVGGK